MISAILANTVEVDEPEIALRDILTQLHLQKNLRKNSVGIIHCNNDFIESGAVEAICDRLPFPVVGINTLLNSSSLGLLDNMLLTICVLTSDQVNFAAVLSDPYTGEDTGPLTKMYVEAESLLSQRPSFMLLYSGIPDSTAVGERILTLLDRFSDGVPIFGSLPADFTTELKNPCVIYNGQAFPDRAAAILVEGQVTPVFNVQNVPLWRGIQQRAIVTESEGNIIKQVNGLPVIDFLESLGLCWYGQISGYNTIPLFLDKNDGNLPVVRSIYGQTAEGHIFISGDAPVDSTLGFGILDEQLVLRAVTEMGHSMKTLYSNIFYVLSCLSRNFALGLNYLADMEKFHAASLKTLPYIFSYSSGEFCPVTNPDGSLKNQFHNMSLVSLAF